MTLDLVYGRILDSAEQDQTSNMYTLILFYTFLEMNTWSRT